MADLQSKNGIRYFVCYQLLWHAALRIDEEPGLDTCIQELLSGICGKYQYEIMNIRLESDTINLKICCPYTVAPGDAIKTLKSISAVQLVQRYPKIRKFYVRHGMVWKPGCTITTIGDALTEI